MLTCPVCRSPDIYAVAGGYLGCVYRCKKCGYWGPLVVEYDEGEGSGGGPSGGEERKKS